jgi:hypothetical protein
VALLGDSLAIKACFFPWNLDCFDVPCQLHSVIAAQKMRLSYIKLLGDGLLSFCLGDIFKNYLFDVPCQLHSVIVEEQKNRNRWQVYLDIVPGSLR